MKDFFEKNPILLGGLQRICQIDETLLSGKRKYNVGNRVSKQTWVFGICDSSTTPAVGFMKVVPDRRAQTLIPIIKEIIRPGTIIWDGEWSAYRNLWKNYVHETVNHKINFVNPKTDAHTQNIESYWNKVKLKIKKRKGTFKGKIDEFITEHLFFERNEGKLFWELLNLIKV